MAEPLHDEDTAPPGDPFEAELVAYLDGELEPAAARRVEARLASDPQARARATSLKKTFDLLDYLPKPEPSSTFTTRTLDKLPAIQPGAVQPKQPPRTPPSPTRTSQPAMTAANARAVPARASAVLPLPLSDPLPDALEPARPKKLAWAAGILVAGLVFASTGYLVASAIRSLQATGRPGARETAEELPLSDRRLVENLPLYSGVDDFAYANELAKPDCFGDDPNVNFDSSLKVPALQPEVPNNSNLTLLEHAFKILSLERQQAIRELDRQIYAQSPTERDRLLRVLEVYSVWLGALSETDRRNVLYAATSELRLKQVREIRDRQWFEQLPPAVRGQHFATEDLKKKRIEELKAEESHRRKDWSYAKLHKSDVLESSRQPWPFDDESRTRDIQAFARVVLRLDEPKQTRLTSNDLDRYNAALSFAQTQGGAAWHSYGRTLYELLKKQDPISGKPIEELLLPPPGESRFRYTTFGELPPPYQSPSIIQRLQSRVSSSLVGKWPEFALEVHKDVPQLHKDFFTKDFPKKDMKYLPPLGPSRPSEFTPEVRAFLDELNKKLSDGDKRGLTQQEGKWPDYPRELIRLSRSHDLSMPGVMLPGSPKKWDSVFGQRKQ